MYEGLISQFSEDFKNKLEMRLFTAVCTVLDAVESAATAHGQRLEADSVAPKPTEASDTTYHELETLPGDIGMCPEVLDIDKLRGRE